MSELFSCPFCDRKAEQIENIEDSSVTYYVECTNCKNSTGIYGTAEESANAWNRRFTPTLSQKDSSVFQNRIVEDYIDELKELLLNVSKESYQKGYDEGNVFGQEFTRAILKHE